MTVVCHRGTFDRVRKRCAAAYLVQVVPCAKSALCGHVQQPHRLARLDAVPAFGHRGCNGTLASRQHAAAPARHSPRHASAPGALLAPAIAQHVHDFAHLAGIALADFVQRQQGIIEQRRRAFQAVAGGAPASPESRAAPHAAGRFDDGGLAGRAVTNKVNAAAFLLAAPQDRPGKGRAQPQHQERIAHGHCSDAGPPAGQGARRGVFVAAPLA